MGVVSDIGFKDPAVSQSMYIFKQPGIGGEVTPHQDSTFLHTEPMKIVGLWFALEDVTLENGCLWFIPGSHKQGVDRRFVRNPDKQSNELTMYTAPNPDYDTTKFIAGPVPKGSCVLIHGEVVHKSERNRSSLSRHVYTFHVIERPITLFIPKTIGSNRPKISTFPDSTTVVDQIDHLQSNYSCRWLQYTSILNRTTWRVASIRNNKFVEIIKLLIHLKWEI